MYDDIQKTEKQKFITKGYRPITFLAVVLVITWVVLIWLGWRVWYSYHETKTTKELHLKIEKLRGTIVHLDEVLTMSALMAATTGNLQWEERYLNFEPKLDAAIKQALSLAPETHSGEAAAKTDAANMKLVDMENRSFNLVRQGRTDEAKAHLLSDQYEEQKKIYTQGMIKLATSLSGIASATLKQEQHQALLHILAVVLLMPFLMIGWSIMFRSVRRWEATLVENNRRLAEQSEELNILNQSLDQKVIQKTKELKQRNVGLDQEILERKKVEEELRENMVELERFSKMSVGREERMIELKEEINELLRNLGQHDKYKIIT
jgi:hypothetical protein